ncbi:MAG: acyl-CoA carboxylase subunit epsilon [Actinomycetales bacterium]|nr:acyl-CoA carboxylase subunit epsilon [Actinomycetales bacterium]
MSEARPPAVRIVRGAPDEVELAALVAGLVAATPELEDEVTAGAHRWANPAHLLRGPDSWRPGADAWRWSLRS